MIKSFYEKVLQKGAVLYTDSNKYDTKRICKERFMKLSRDKQSDILTELIKSGTCFPTSIRCNDCPVFDSTCEPDRIKKDASMVFVSLFGSDKLFEILISRRNDT